MISILWKRVLEKLSDELWMMILEFLDFGDLGGLAQAS